MLQPVTSPKPTANSSHRSTHFLDMLKHQQAINTSSSASVRDYSFALSCVVCVVGQPAKSTVFVSCSLCSQSSLGSGWLWSIDAFGGRMVRNLKGAFGMRCRTVLSCAEISNCDHLRLMAFTDHLILEHSIIPGSKTYLNTVFQPGTNFIRQQD